MRRVVIAVLVLGALTGPRPLEAKPVTVRVKVVDRSGPLLFVKPGADSGIRPGDQVVLDGRKRKVVATSRSFAAVERGSSRTDTGAVGTVVVDDERGEETVERIAPAEKLSAFRGAWGAPQLPAERQHPKPVPLGPTERASRSRLYLTSGASAIVPLGEAGDTLLRGEARARLHYEPFREVAFAFDADASVQGWTGADGRASPESRPAVTVRQLEAGLGSETSARARAGRLRHASTTAGMLDGVALRTPSASGFSLAAFGGVIPDPLSGTPDTAASRFGAEARYDESEHELRPHLALGAQASRFDGAFDERLLTASADFYPDFGRFGARTQVQLFDRRNPWGASPVELAAAEADAGIELGKTELGLVASVRRPERSRWLASFLPPEWLCPRDVAGDCVGDGSVYAAAATFRLHLGPSQVDLGGSGARTSGADASQAAAFTGVHLREIVGTFRTDLGVTVSSSTLVRSAAVVLAPGIELFDGHLDASVRYRPALSRYTADTSQFVEHDIGPSLWIAPHRTVDIFVDGDYITGRDLDVLLLQARVGYRPDL